MRSAIKQIPTRNERRRKYVPDPSGASSEGKSPRLMTAATSATEPTTRTPLARRSKRSTELVWRE